jgi:thymidylate synthase ThyX
MARVSNPSNQNNTETSARLIKYLIDHKHWSPFEMVNMCVEIETQLVVLLHRSLDTGALAFKSLVNGMQK